MNQPPFSVLIIGAGRIAGGFDAQRPELSPPLAHVKAYQQHGGFEVEAVIEPDAATRKSFQQRWKLPVDYTSFGELQRTKNHFDVISICSPTIAHASDLESALTLKPKLIFCEKPLTFSLAESRRLATACKETNVILAVAHLRRWAPDIVRLRERLHQGYWGKLRAVQAIYNKGVLNNGSHLIDLLHFLFGELKLTGVGQPVIDYLPEDPSVPAMLETTEGVCIQLAVAHAADYALFEVQLITEHGIISMENGGLQWRFRSVTDSRNFNGYRVLTEGTTISGEVDLAFKHAISNIYEALTQGSPLASTGETALAAQHVCEMLHQQANERRSFLPNYSSTVLQ